MIIVLNRKLIENFARNQLYLTSLPLWNILWIFTDLSEQVSFVGLQLCWGVFYRILQGKILTILLFTSCAPTKFTWSSLGTINISKIDKNVLSWFLNGWRKILVTYVYLCYKLWYNILCLAVLRCMIACACSRTRRALIKHF